MRIEAAEAENERRTEGRSALERRSSNTRKNVELRELTLGEDLWLASKQRGAGHCDAKTS